MMLRQFDVCRLPNRTLVVILQDDVADWTASRVVAPLLPSAKVGNMPKTLCATVDFGEAPHVILIPSLSSVPTSSLSPPVFSLSRHRDDIIRALDLLFTGV